jgi:hypothetical protein
VPARVNRSEQLARSARYKAGSWLLLQRPIFDFPNVAKKAATPTKKAAKRAVEKPAKKTGRPR